MKTRTRIRLLCRASYAVILMAAVWGLGAAAQATLYPPDPLKSSDIHPRDVIRWEAVGAYPEDNDSIVAYLNLGTLQNFAIYKEKLAFTSPSGQILEVLMAPEPDLAPDPLTGKIIDVFREGTFSLRVSELLLPDAHEVAVEVTFTGCTEEICLFPYTHPLTIPLYRDPLERPRLLQQASLLRHDPARDQLAPTPPAERPRLQTQLANLFRDESQLPVVALMLAVFLGGLLTNLTPCVYPMIPITLRILGSQTRKPLLNAVLYATGILTTYTSLGLFASFSGGMFGEFMANATVNLIFAVVMMLLGMSMLGFGSFTALQRLGSRLGAGTPSRTNIFLMGTGAGFVAAPCTGPVLAALLAYTAQNQNAALGSALLFCYSLGFALPYVVLGGAAARVAQIQVGPKLQIATKLLFAAVMFALGIYYLRIPAYGVLQAIRPHFAEIAVFGLGFGTLLLISWLLQPRLHHHRALAMIPSLTLGIGIFGGSQWLVTGGSLASPIYWHASEEAGFAAATRSNKLIMIDGWAEWCEACKVMDATTFRDERVIAELNQYWEAIKLDLTESNEQNNAIITRYGLPGLPTLILLPPNADIDQMKRIVGEQSASELLEKLHRYRQERG